LGPRRNKGNWSILDGEVATGQIPVVKRRDERTGQIPIVARPKTQSSEIRSPETYRPELHNQERIIR